MYYVKMCPSPPPPNVEVTLGILKSSTSPLIEVHLMEMEMDEYEYEPTYRGCTVIIFYIQIITCVSDRYKDRSA